MTIEALKNWFKFLDRTSVPLAVSRLEMSSMIYIHTMFGTAQTLADKNLTVTVSRGSGRSI